MTEYAKYQIPASKIASLCGQFGPYVQFDAICDVIRRSEYKHLLLPDRNPYVQTFKESSCYDAQQVYLTKSCIRPSWEILKTEAQSCSTQQHIQGVMLRCMRLLFHNTFMETYLADQSNIYPLLWPLVIGVVEHPGPETLESLRHEVLSVPAALVLLQTLESAVQLFSYVKRLARISYGTLGERAYVRQFNEHADTSRQIHGAQRNLCKISDTSPPWGLYGRIDGQIGNTMVEIKHRTERLGDIPVYDIIQVHAYMYMSNANHMKLIECVRSNDGLVSTDTMIFFHTVFWDAIMHKLTGIITFIDSLISSDIAWDSFVRCNPTYRHDILLKYIGKPINALSSTALAEMTRTLC
jgi:hypothetical protein